MLVRWTWRDFRRHWVAVVVIAMVIGIGTGVFAGLGSTGTWRRLSNDASFDALEMHDLRIALSPGTFADEGQLEALVRSIEHPELVEKTNERLHIATQVDASTADETIFVAGRLVGLDPDRGPDILWVDEGRAPEPDTGVLEVKFANAFDLPSEGTVELAGGETLAYHGLGSLPTDFYVSGERGDLLAQFNFAVLYTDLGTAQRLADRPGAVNDAVIGLVDGADRTAVQHELEDVLASGSGFSATITTRDEDEAFRIVYADIESDQRFWNVLSGLVLGSAALAAFNLISRVVESQRREIGVGMALGAPAARLAIRPLLIGLQTAVLGCLIGIGVGVLVGAAMRSLLLDLVPLPVWRTPFQFGRYAQAAALGLIVPITSAAVPVVRAIRVEPIDAIRTGHLAARRTPATLRRVRVPGASLNQMPLRNFLRTPRRTMLTALGVGAAITALVAVLGMLDSFGRTIEIGDDETSQEHPDRITASLDTIHPVDGAVPAAVREVAGVDHVDLGMQFPATISAGPDEIEVLVEAIDFDRARWTPTLTSGSITGTGNEIVLAKDAAGSLGVSVGDTISVTHPARESATAYSLRTTEVVVASLHPNPLRIFAYIDLSTADRFGLAGLTNVAQVFPAAGVDRAEVERTLFEMSGVASAQPVARTREVFEDAIDQFTAFLVITEVAVLTLASLIAFNSTRITLDERTREHATMLAFGTPVRSVLATIIKEGVLVGAVATVIGIIGGYATLSWIINVLFAQTLPDLDVVTYVSLTTLSVAIVIGLVAVALAPVVMTRRLTRMNLPDTLRVVE
ncbi:MAG: FtsX-like permease family protein [Acidimicrobiia bacterium]|nr:FtsX-like permease family protein [Acidimicrobiia bacterium]